MNYDLIVKSLTILAVMLGFCFIVYWLCKSYDFNNQTKLQLRQIDSWHVQHSEPERLFLYFKILETQNGKKAPIMYIEKPEVNLLPKTK